MAVSGASFLGSGWSFPPTFTHPALGVEMVSGEQDIHESLTLLLNTALGERLMVPDYGCQLRDYLFQELTRTVLTQMENDVRRAILRWEPRITVDNVRAEADPQTPGLVNIAVSHTVRLTNTRSNFVYPFYTNEVTIAPRGP